MSLITTIDKMFPDESSPQEIRSWRRRIALVACSTFFIQWVVLMPALFMELPKVGQVVWADQVDQQIAALEKRTNEQMAEVKDRLNSTDRKITEQSTILRQMRIDSMEKKLKDLQREWCLTTVRSTKELLDVQIADEMRRYRSLAGEEYRSRACEVL